MRKISKNRIWEIDMARGILVILMIILHILFNLEYFYNIPVNYSYGIINVLRNICATFFIIISGISTFFSRSSIKRGLWFFLLQLSLLWPHIYLTVKNILYLVFYI